MRDTYHRDPKTLRKYFDRYEPLSGELRPGKRPVNFIIDATFFKRTDGLIVCRANGENRYWKEIPTEKVEYYGQCLDVLEAAGFRFRSFTIDGRRGVRQLLLERHPEVPLQLCHFHQLLTITHYLTTRPKLPAGKELRDIALTLTKTTREACVQKLEHWHRRWNDFLKERTFDPHNQRRWQYTHRRLRSAYRSLKTNVPWLFTYLDHPDLHIPNTTNSCDGSFAHWKSKVTLHRSIERNCRRKKMINYLLERPDAA